MKCPSCRKAIPDGSEKHPDCGWGYAEPAMRYAPVEPTVSPEASKAAYNQVRGRLVDTMRRPKPQGIEIWQRILDRHARGESVCSLAVQWAKEIVGRHERGEPLHHENYVLRGRDDEEQSAAQR